MEVMNMCAIALGVQILKLGDGHGKDLIVPPNQLARVQGPRRSIRLLGGSLFHEFPGLFIIESEGNGDLEQGIFVLPQGRQLWYRLPGTDAFLHVWRHGEAPEQAPPP